MEPNIFERRKILDENRGSPLSREVLSKIRAPKVNATKKKVIAYGETIPSIMKGNDDDIESFLHTWLRVCNKYDELTICFAKDPSKYKMDKIQVSGNTTPRMWHTRDGIDRAKSLIRAQLVRARNVVQVTLNDQGITIWTDAAKEFSPTRKATAKDIASYAEIVKELQEDRKQKGLPIEEVPALKSGDPVLNEEWEPFVSWLPSNND